MLLRRLSVLAFLSIWGVGAAHADGMLPDGGTLKFNKLLLHEDNSKEAAEPKKDPESKWNYFNLAHCVCSFFNYNADSADPEFFEDTFQYEITVENSTMSLNRPVEFWVGSDCANPDSTIRDRNCFQVGSLDISAIQSAGAGYIDIPIYDLMVPVTGERPGCMERLQSSTTWGLVDADADATFEYSISDQIETDTDPPPLPTAFSATGAEEAINISWTSPAEGTADIAYYQALCARTIGDSASPGKSNPPTARYLTARQLCNASQDITLTPSDIVTNSDADAGTGSITLPEELANLDPSYLCGETMSSSATSLRIDGLKNGVGYTVVLLAIDKYGNASGTYFTQELVPQPATDFWEDIHDRGSGVEGGFCLLAQTYGDDNPLTQALRAFRDETLASTAYGRWLIDVYYGTVGSLDLHGSVALRIVVGIVALPLVALALLWHLLTLPGLLGLGLALYLVRRHRLRMPRWAAAATTLALLVLVPARAHAQHPYWEDQSVGSGDGEELALGDPRRVQWHAGLRAGPYVPGIDAQLDMPVGKYDGPYEQMFGGYSILPMLDVERFFLYSYGQLGAGISLGYLGKKAHPWEAGSDPTDPKRPRSSGDENVFRLFPFSVNATYRLTYLDDEFGIPFVPYARAGLAYYVWWVDAPNGDFAESCVDGSDSAMCKTTSARGATLGFVGSIGLALRAERVDGDAARSMRESGIEHAGFYAEYSVGKVDGFGSDKKLSVGDATWFAGVDFEF